MYFIKIKIQKCLNFNFFFPQFIFFINSTNQFSNINKKPRAFKFLKFK
jgi:hypothetical protein